MSNSEPVYSFDPSSGSPSPDLSRINEVIGRYLRAPSIFTEDSKDSRLLGLRHELLGKMVSTAECISDVEQLLGEVNDIIAESIYAACDRDIITQECVTHWKKTLLPLYSDQCVETIRIKLQGALPLEASIDIRFAVARGLKNQIPWEDLLLAEVGPVITRTPLFIHEMRRSVQLIQSEYESALRIAKL